MFSFAPKVHVILRDEAVAQDALDDPRNRNKTEVQIAGACIRHERANIACIVMGMPTNGTAVEFRDRLIVALNARAT